MDRTHQTACIDGRIPRAWVVVSAEHGERDHASAARAHRDRRIREVVVRERQITALLDLTFDLAGAVDLRTHGEPRDSSLQFATDQNTGPGRTPQHSVCVPRLLHARVVGIGVRLDFVVGRFRREKELPAPGAEQCRVIDAFTKRNVARLLIRLRRVDVRLAVDRPARDPERRCRRVQRSRIRYGPEADAPRRAERQWANIGDRAEQVLGAVAFRRILPHRRVRRPHGKPRQRVDLQVFDKRHADARGVRGELRLGECENLRCVEVGPEQIVLVGRDIDAILIGADVRVVLETRTGRRAVERAAMVGRPVGAVILRRDAIDRPRAGRVAGIADRDIDRIFAVEVAGRADMVKRRDRDDEPVVVGVVIADRVDHVRAELEGV